MNKNRYLATLGAGKLCSSTKISSLNARSRAELNIREQERQKALKVKKISYKSIKGGGLGWGISRLATNPSP